MHLKTSLGLAVSGLALSPRPAWAGYDAASGNFAAIAFAIAGLSFALACCLWALSERIRVRTLRRSLREERACARSKIGLRDALIASGREAILMWRNGALPPLSFGNAAALADACAKGPDAGVFLKARDALLAGGTPFALVLKLSETRAVAARGCAVGGRAAIYLEETVPQDEAPVVRDADDLDAFAVLDALSVPVWVRAKDMSLRWVNRAFMDLNGSATREDAIAADFAFDRSERDLAAAACDAGEKVTAKRYAQLGDARRAFFFSLYPLPGGGVAGTALDPREAEDDAQKQQAEAFGAALDRLSDAVVIFGSDRRLAFYNRAYAQLWNLPSGWLDTCPSQAVVLDRLRENRRLPEQRDFASWKMAQLRLHERADFIAEELWHLPDGKSLRVLYQPIPSGGLVVVYQDVSEALRHERSGREQANVQQAFLERIPEGTAVFGSDGKLRFFNKAFAHLWRFDEDDLRPELHVRRLAELCRARFGSDEVWRIVSDGIGAAAYELQDGAVEAKRADGAIVSIAFSRLTDGATLVGFTDTTMQHQLEAERREAAVAA